jgi:hypothetical protein
LICWCYIARVACEREDNEIIGDSRNLILTVRIKGC